MSFINSSIDKVISSFNGKMPPLAPAKKVDLETIPNIDIRNKIDLYKTDNRGPYKILNWYCDDGTVNPANEPCGEKGGVQRATYRDEIKDLGEKHHVFLGQILATTDKKAFLDQEFYFSRMKQYQLEKYLRAVDDGWINQKAQFYRGAVQAEDEENWGKEFFEEILNSSSFIDEHYFLLREAVRDIPHSGDTNIAQKMRSESKSIADQYPSFTPLRIKIHGRPDPTDIEMVKNFQTEHKTEMPSSIDKKLNTLQETMTEYFKPIDATQYKSYVQQVNNKLVSEKLLSFLDDYESLNASDKLSRAAEAMWYIRNNISKESSPKGRLALFDLSLRIENLIKNSIYQYKTETVKELIQQIRDLAKAAAASGATEIWEYTILEQSLNQELNQSASLAKLNDFLLAARNQLEWGTGKTGAIYSDVVELYSGFEPLATSFIDDRIRSSVTLELGNSIGKLGNFITKESALNNQVFSLENQSHIHGLNPGYASGKLIIIKGNDTGVEVNPNNIYVFEQAPSDLKPVSGILTVSEGNLVSHVQLLARNLGIPNAAISQSVFNELKDYDNTEVFYAVSNKGTVIMKPAIEMTSEEQNLVKKEVQEQEMITIDTKPIKLDVNTVLNLRDIDATASGIYCGPKAANMGQLKKLFPEHVVEGMVIPFGVFLDHMKQQIPGESYTYWEFLNQIFAKAKQMKSNGESAKSIEQYELAQLAILREKILQMSLKESFISDLNDNFKARFNKPLGDVGVFLRSDTNMEDLSSFTGAGLNLTLFNVKDKMQILNGIKEVWASPYSERSFKWRQNYLTNPESVFPSILVIPGVDNDCSGVMITKGVNSGSDKEITTAFSLGVGGAVDGQVAETWTLKKGNTSRIVSPAREGVNKYLSPNSGLRFQQTAFNIPVLNEKKQKALLEFSDIIKERMSEDGKDGPWDMELGFKDDKLWLFQIRPFVENSSAKSSKYLESITPNPDMNKQISLTQTIN